MRVTRFSCCFHFVNEDFKYFAWRELFRASIYSCLIIQLLYILSENLLSTKFILSKNQHINLFSRQSHMSIPAEKVRKTKGFLTFSGGIEMGGVKIVNQRISQLTLYCLVLNKRSQILKKSRILCRLLFAPELGISLSNPFGTIFAIELPLRKYHYSNRYLLVQIQQYKNQNIM